MSETKGMENPAGENHCFLNVLIQSLYRLTEFRERFLQIAHHHSMLDVAGDGSACVLCSLQTIWNAYKQRDLPGSLNPSGVRSALAHLDDAFARYKQADAGETLLRILDHLHEQLTKSHPSNLTLSPLLAPSSEALSLALCSSDVKSRCLIHELFAWETQTITRCPRCDDHVKGEMGWTLLVDGTKLKKEWSLLSSTPRLGRLVTDPSNLSETLISCPNERCSERQAKRNVALLSAPPIFQISISWPWDPTDTAMPRIKQAATDLLNAIDSPLYLKDMYASASKSDAEYRLQGFVAYYGLHYVAYQLVRRSDGPPIWHHFNDANVHVLSTWQDCKESVHKGGYLPVLLWYVRKPSRN
jgi:ubiquitin C-terminal hydrolase